jgi:hypothetical protein
VVGDESNELDKDLVSELEVEVNIGMLLAIV